MRVYAITYDIYESCGGSFKYAANPKKEPVTEFYSRFERDKFIQKWLDLNKPDKDLYIDNIECYVSYMEKINDMKLIIDAI